MMIEKKLKRKKTLIKTKKILKICKVLFILWVIYLIGIPLYYTPYELQPSYWEFRKMCKLNELPNNEEKYNKILAYYNMNWDTMIKTKKPFQLVEFIDKTRHTLSDDMQNIHKITKPIPNKFSYEFDTKTIKNRIKFGFDIYVHIENGNIKPERFAWFTAEWQTFRIEDIEWNIATSGDFRMPTKILDCDYFKNKK